jgi:hypothetical protein
MKNEEPTGNMALSSLKHWRKSRYQGLEYRPEPAQCQLNASGV